MAQHFTCDLCESECPKDRTRRWVHLSGDLGFEITILQGQLPTEMDICDTCVLKMCWELVENRSPQLGIKKLQAEVKASHSKLEERERSVALQEQILESKSSEFEGKQKTLEARLLATKTPSTEQLDNTVAQLKAANHKITQLNNTLSAKDRTIDKLNNTIQNLTRKVDQAGQGFDEKLQQELMKQETVLANQWTMILNQQRSELTGKN